jgi:hypothetical protein
MLGGGSGNCAFGSGAASSPDVIDQTLSSAIDPWGSSLGRKKRVGGGARSERRDRMKMMMMQA